MLNDMDEVALAASSAMVEPIGEAPLHPVLNPVMRQCWRDLTFLHWRYEPSVIRPLVPSELRLDLFDGMAWIGLVPFLIEDLTLPTAPALPWLSKFPETNVRTYVIDAEGRRAVWFFSLDAARLLAVIGARTAYALPYFWAKMRVERRGESIRYASTRRQRPKASSDIDVRIGERVVRPSELEVFLTARFRLVAKRGGRILRADIVHQPWPLQRARIARLEQNLLQAAGLPQNDAAPLVHFAKRVDVLVGPATALRS
jgi:uncharacterized protein YqjF (DUF2071 family)